MENKFKKKKNQIIRLETICEQCEWKFVEILEEEEERKIVCEI